MIGIEDKVEEHTSVGSLESTPADGMDWFSLVDRIQRHDAAAMEELYALFSRGIRYYLCRQLGPQDLDDKVHDCFLIVVQAIQRGDLREPDRLMGFARTVVRRQIAAHIDSAVQCRRQQVDFEATHIVADSSLDPEATALSVEKEKIAGKVLKSISRRDREILTRFYLEEESQDEICRQMNLTETQFRLLKSRAKARFGELGRRSMGTATQATAIRFQQFEKKA
jgi:RNA polymerase sigma-70 factor (ECF subfamily)